MLGFFYFTSLSPSKYSLFKYKKKLKHKKSIVINTEIGPASPKNHRLVLPVSN